MNPPPDPAPGRAPERAPSSGRSFFRFCPRCGAGLEPFRDEDRERRRCPACGFIQYRNPIVGAAIILFESEIVALLGEERMRQGILDEAWRPLAGRPRVLLARRAWTYRGRWCFPCGFVEYDEEIREAAVREAEEETGLRVEPGEIFAVHSNFHLPDEQSVGIWFRATPRGGTLRPGDDVDGLGFFEPGSVEVPLAFPTDGVVLRKLAAMGTPGP